MLRLRAVIAASVLAAALNAQSLDDWLKQLHNPDPQKRLAAVGALRAYPPDDTVLSALIAALHDPGVRMGAARVLAELGTGTARVVPALIELLDDPEPTVRGEAAYDLGKIGPPAAVAAPKLGALLGDPDRSVRLSAIRSLGAVAPSDAGAQALLVSQLRDPEQQIRSQALAALGRLGEPSRNFLPQFLAALEDPVEYVCGTAAEAIGNLGPAAASTLPALIAASRKVQADTPPFLAAIVSVSKDRPAAAVRLLIESIQDSATTLPGRWIAMAALGDIGEPARSSMAALSKASKEGPEWQRKAAADALAKVSPDLDVSTPDAMSQAVRLLAGDDPSLQQRASKSLVARPAAIPALLELLQTAPSEATRLSVVRTLREMAFRNDCRSAAAAIPALTEIAAGAGSDALQAEAAGALGHCVTLSESAAQPVVRALTKALDNPAARREALWSLGNLRNASASAAPAIQALLEQALKSDPPDGKMIVASVNALGQIGAPARGAAPLILPLLDERDFELHGAAVIALGGMQVSAAVPALARDLQSPYQGVREAAARAMWQIFADPTQRGHASDTLPLLLPHLKDSAATVRAMTVQALAHSGSSAAVRTVIEALGDPNDWVRVNAAMGLGTLVQDPGDDWVREAALPALIKALEDADPNVATYAASSLERFGSSAATALPALHRAQGRLTGGMRQSIARSIAAIEAKP